MSERDQTPSPYGSRSAQEDPNPRPADESWREQTTPGLSPVTGGSSAVGSGAHGYVGPGENYQGPGEYILPLERLGENGYQVVPLPRSPGFPSGRPRIYPSTPQTREQVKEIHKAASFQFSQ